MKIKSIEIENLRGYSYMSMNLDKSFSLVVGPNNAGKTSVFKILEWVFNVFPIETMNRSYVLNENDMVLLVPASNIRHRARRIYLHIEDANRKEVLLRFNFRQTPNWHCYCTLGRPTKSEKVQSDKKAFDILKQLRDVYVYLYIPSFRDSRSERFRNTFSNALMEKIEEKTIQNGRTGETKKTNKALESLKNIAETLTKPIWKEMLQSIPQGLVKDGEIIFNADRQTLIDWIQQNLYLRISTGAHDIKKVELSELGSGLQSLLDFSIHARKIVDKKRIMIIEEPEAFLHPAAQRSVINSIVSNLTENDNIWVTTHSPIIVEEVQFDQVVICKDQRFYFPKDLARKDINSALLNGFGAEMVFASSVLLVEGESDRLFFDNLRRRLSKLDNSGSLNKLFVVPVGSKSQFAPWIRLIESFSHAGHQPIKWRVVADGDASTEIREAFLHAGISLNNDIRIGLGEVKAQMTSGNIQNWKNSVCKLNQQCQSLSTRFNLASIDLEDAILTNISERTLQALCMQLKINEMTAKEECLKKLGSKGANASISDPVKAPWIRGWLGKSIGWDELDINLQIIIKSWFLDVLPNSILDDLCPKLVNTLE